MFPEDIATSKIDPQRPTLYVLADRGLSDLLVLSEITLSSKLPNPLDHIPVDSLSNYHSVYSIASSSPMIDWIRRRRKQSSLLSDFLGVLQQQGELDLQLVPVSVFWGRPLARQKHWLKVLFADTWVLAGRTRRFFTILIQGRSTRLVFSAAIDFKTLASGLQYDAGELHRHLLGLLSQQREATFGPQLSNRKLLIAEVIEDRQVQQVISTPGTDSRQQTTRAQRYCREIFADCTQLTIEVMLRLLRLFWNRFYSGIEIYNAERIRQIALSHQLVYVPCHRSHLDYLLLSYVIYNENLAIPYIAAGNNLNIPFIGRILRGGGAFFIRRSFKDNPLYRAVIDAYVSRLVKLAVPLEYFVEGGRSRSGRMLKPKLGMLGMTIKAYIQQQSKPLAFIPVYIGYEKLIEGKAYLGELYGEKKRSESTFGALSAIFKLKGYFGKVTASFGEPIEINHIFEQNCSDWSRRAAEIEQKPGWYRNSLIQLSQQIMYGINRACVINPVNSIATILLATQRHSIDIDDLIAQSALQHRLIENSPRLASIHIAGPVDRDQIERIARQKLIHIRRHELGDIIYLEPQDAVLMGYYRNNSLHSLIMPALIACCFTNEQRLSYARLVQKIELLYPFLKSELQLEWQESSLLTIIDECVASMIEESLLLQTEQELRRPKRSNPKYMQLIRLARIAQPILERYYMTFTLLWQSSGAALTEAELELSCHLLAQKISMLHGINSPDFFDRLLFQDFVATMLENGYLVKNDQQQLNFTPGFKYVSLDLRSLLSTEVRSSILSLIGN